MNAKKLIEMALETDGASVPALLAQARMLASQGDFPGADAALDKLTSLDASNAQAWRLMGDLRVEQRKPDEARAAYGKAISLSEGNYGALFKRALLALQSQDYEAAQLDAVDILTQAGFEDINPGKTPSDDGTSLGRRTHEMGTVRMGRDPKTSVLNGWNQAHDIPNLFITDGSFMTSSACQNPSLTYMAFSARAAHHAADLLSEGVL